MYIERTDNMSLLFPAPPTLVGKLLTLRSLAASDAEALHRLTVLDICYANRLIAEKKFELLEMSVAGLIK